MPLFFYPVGMPRMPPQLASALTEPTFGKLAVGRSNGDDKVR